MQELDPNKSQKIVGGGISVWGILGIGTLLSFLSGIIDGIARPLKCH